MEITIENCQKRIPLPPTKIKKITKQILKNEGVKDATLSLVFVTDQAIKSLNKKFLKRNYATDVLAFDLGDEVFNPKKTVLEGEIIISTTTAFRNAKAYDTKPFDEVTLYIIHGILHLIGYDDHRKKDIKEMRLREQQLMKMIKG